MSITLNGDTGITTPMYNGTISANAVTPSVNMKNRIINGAMVIDQRNAGASGTAGAYTVDRWAYSASQASKGTWQQNAGSVTPPAGFTNYLGFTSSSAYSITSTDYFDFVQQIEGYNMADLGWGTANAKTVTLSFWVRSSLTGTFGGSLSNSAFDRSYPFSYTISSANTWEQKSVTIAGDTTGTWLTTNGKGIGVTFGMGVGSTYSGTAGSWAGTLYVSATGATSVVGTSGATFYITGVQLEVGSSATSFDYRQYGQELALCQRYYSKFNSVSGNYVGFASGYCDTTTAAFFFIQYPVGMRTNPTVTQNQTQVYSTSGYPVTSIGTGYYGGQSAAVNFNTAGTMTVGKGAVLLGNNDANAYLSLSAEL